MVKLKLNYILVKSANIFLSGSEATLSAYSAYASIEHFFRIAFTMSKSTCIQMILTSYAYKIGQFDFCSNDSTTFENFPNFVAKGHKTLSMPKKKQDSTQCDEKVFVHVFLSTHLLFTFLKKIIKT